MVIMVSLDWKMSLIAFAALPVVAIFVNRTRRRIRDAFREIRSKTARMNAYVNEQISGMAVVQACAQIGSTVRPALRRQREGEEGAGGFVVAGSA